MFFFFFLGYGNRLNDFRGFLHFWKCASVSVLFYKNRERVRESESERERERERE